MSGGGIPGTAKEDGTHPIKLEQTDYMQSLNQVRLAKVRLQDVLFH